MNFETFFEEVRSNKVELKFDNPVDGPTARLSNEALFHLPLLAVTILLLAKTKRKPRIDELGQGSSQHLGWSANLRMRTVRALTFLETASLVAIDKSKGRISATESGKTVVDAAMRDGTDLAYTLRVIERSYRNVSVEKQISLGL